MSRKRNVHNPNQANRRLDSDESSFSPQLSNISGFSFPKSLSPVRLNFTAERSIMKSFLLC